MLQVDNFNPQPPNRWLTGIISAAAVAVVTVGFLYFSGGLVPPNKPALQALEQTVNRDHKSHPWMVSRRTPPVMAADDEANPVANGWRNDVFGAFANPAQALVCKDSPLARLRACINKRGEAQLPPAPSREVIAWPGIPV